MNAFRPLTDGPTTAFLFNLAWQSVIIMGAAWGASKALRSRPIPLQRAVLVGTLVVLGLLPAVSALYHFSDLTWDMAGIFSADRSADWIDTARAARQEDNQAYGSRSAPSHPPLAAGKESSGDAPASRPAGGLVKSPAAKDRFLSAGAMNLLILVWLAGTAGLLVRFVCGWLFVFRFRRDLVRLRDSRTRRVVKAACQVFGIRFMPAVYTSRAAGSPLTFGLISPRLVLPDDLYASLTDNELRSIVVHELAHLSQKDLAIGMLQRIVTILFWWNPFVHALNRALNLRMEEMCDNHAARDAKDPLRYARCLVSLAEKIHPSRPIPGAVGISHPRWSLEERVRALLARRSAMATALRPRAARVTCLAFGIGLFLAAGCQVLTKDWEEEDWICVTFRTSEPAPERFDGWTFFWQAPEYDPSAALDYVVLDQQGKRCCTYHKKFGWPMGAPIRSDFAEDVYGGDPAVHFGGHIFFKIRVAAGAVRFSSLEDFHFAFYEPNEAGRIDWQQPFRTVGAVADASELEAAVIGLADTPPTLHVEGGEEGCSVTFLTEREAPDRFDGWTFHWRGPRLEPGARLGYVVTHGGGEEYYSHSVGRLSDSVCVRSDFSRNFAGGDPAVFFGKPISLTFHVDRGSIDFPWYRGYNFAFYEEGPDGKIDRKNPLAIIRAKVAEKM